MVVTYISLIVSYAVYVSLVRESYKTKVSHNHELLKM